LHPPTHPCIVVISHNRTADLLNIALPTCLLLMPIPVYCATA
jgi:hypothetical protein